MTSSSDRIERGTAIRRSVLGAAHVDRSDADLNEFTRPMRELVNEFCWGSVWTRPGLELKQRSLLNIGVLIALNRPRELAIHVRGAIATGCSRTEIQEALIQTAVYCGVPAALDAFRVASAVLDEFDCERSTPTNT